MLKRQIAVFDAAIQFAAPPAAFHQHVAQQSAIAQRTNQANWKQGSRFGDCLPTQDLRHSLTPMFLIKERLGVSKLESPTTDAPNTASQPKVNYRIRCIAQLKSSLLNSPGIVHILKSQQRFVKPMNSIVNSVTNSQITPAGKL
jgi:hypothetical protein